METINKIVLALFMVYLLWMLFTFAYDEVLMGKECPEPYDGHITLNRGSFLSIGKYKIICVDVETESFKWVVKDG